MVQNTKPVTLEDVAMIATNELPESKGESYDDTCFAEGYYKGFIAGAQWQKEQDKEVLLLAYQLLHAFRFRYPNEGQLLAGWENNKAFDKIHSHLYPNP